jgi:tetratricopeptide (TPR) repeat protein
MIKMSAHPASKEVFLSYAEADEKLALELEKHLSVLKREGFITTWHKGQIGAGTDRNKEISKRLSTASIILLLLSANFVASDACYSIEMQLAVERHEAGEASVIPVMLRPMDDWQNTPFGKLVVLPSNGVPVTGWGNEHAAFADVARGIRLVLRGEKLTPAVITPPLPSIWNIPYPRNPVFTGREEILTRIESQLQAGQAMALSQPQAISGLGGIGKTQIVVEFAYQHHQNYQIIFWVLADNRESLVSGYIAFAGLLNLPEKDQQDQQIIIEAVKRWLQTHGSWLLILDNADDLAMVREFVPTVFGGHILLTTRAQSMGRLAKQIEVETMDQDVGALFLLRRAGLIAEDASLDAASSSSADVILAYEICKELGGLPLALDQAGAYIEEIPCSLTEYLHLYRTQRTELLKERGGLVEDHREPVATTWSISFKKVEERNPAAADLLRMSAFVHPDAIPEEMITKGTTYFESPLREVSIDALLLNKAIAALSAYSLIRRDLSEKTLSVHRLVQAVLRDTMDEPTRKLWAERAVLAVNAIFPEVEFATWPQCEQYLSHALVCADLVEQEQINSLEAARLLNEAGWYLHDRARYVEAEPLYKQALDIWEQRQGPKHLDAAGGLNNLAELYRAQGKYAEAEPLYLRVLAICEQQLGELHPSTATSLNNLACLYQTRGKYAEAEPLYEQALLVNEKVYGEKHPSTATSLNNLALLYEAQGKHAEAEPLYLRALVIHERQLGADHPSTAQSLNNLAGLYEAQGKYAEAEPLYKRALVIDEKVHGEKHPSTATSLNNLGSLYWSQGKYEQAEPFYVRALSIDEEVHGLEHPDVARDVHNLATLYERQGKYTEAEQLFKRALSIYERQLGEGHHWTATCLNNLAGLYRIQGKYAEAEPLYKRVLVIDEQVSGVDHPEVATGLNNLAGLYRIQGKYGEAEPLYERALAICEQQLGEMHSLTAASLNNLALLYADQGKYAEAEPLYLRALAIHERQLGADHPSTAQSLNNLAALYVDQGKDAEAELLFKRALTIREQVLGEAHPLTKSTREWYVSLLRKMGRDEEVDSLEAGDDVPEELK